jgi:threonine-phosphate decarboxylase
MKRRAMPKIVDFTLISNPLGPSNKARHAMRKAIKSVDLLPQTRHFTRYLCSREGIAEEELLLGGGVSNILSLLLQALKLRSTLLPYPVPQFYERALQEQHVGISPFPLDYERGFRFSAEEFRLLLRDVEAVLVLNPHNPTGVVMPQALIADMARTCFELGKILIIDESLSDYAPIPYHAQQVISTGRSTILLRSFSSYYALAGLRLGYAIGHAEIISQVRPLAGRWPVNSVALAAAIASLKDKGYRRRTAEVLSAEAAYSLKKLQGLRKLEPLATPWGFLIRAQPVIPGLKELLADRGIIADEYSDAQGNQYLPFLLRSRPENARFLRALQRILRENDR